VLGAGVYTIRGSDVPLDCGFCPFIVSYALEKLSLQGLCAASKTAAVIFSPLNAQQYPVESLSTFSGSSNNRIVKLPPSDLSQDQEALLDLEAYVLSGMPYP